MFEAKKFSSLTFEELARKLGRDEVAVAGIFYEQIRPSPEDMQILADTLGISNDVAHYGDYRNATSFPDRGRLVDMPPKEPLIYRLYEIVQNYGYAYKAVINEKFGDGIMSAISFSTKVEKETDRQGDWVKITMRGKW